MARVVTMLAWTAILTLPGGVLLLPVVVARHLAKRKQQKELPGADAADAPAVETDAA